MPNISRGIRKTKPGAVDDDAVSRAKNRMRQLEQSAKPKEDMNPIDGANEELENDEPSWIRKIFES